MRAIPGVLLLFLAAIMPVIGVAAQGASTPAVSDSAANGQVVYIDDSGNPIANATVNNVVRNWQDYVDSDDPGAGAEYIAFTITVESVITRATVQIDESDFLLQDSAGFLWDPSGSVEAAEGVEIIPLESDLDLGNAQSATFLVIFTVFQGQELEHLFWQPDSGRLITLAELEGV